MLDKLQLKLKCKNTPARGNQQKPRGIFSIGVCSSVFVSFMFMINAATAAPSNEQVLPIEKWQTKNGASVYYVHLPELPIVDIDVLFNAGSSQDGNNYGVASFTSNMIGQSAKNLSADEIAEQFDDIAALFDTLRLSTLLSIY